MVKKHAYLEQFLFRPWRKCCGQAAQDDWQWNITKIRPPQDNYLQLEYDSD